MPKLRLNREYRDVLSTHARKFVNNLPLNPEDTQELRDAEARRDAVSAALIAAARAAVAAHIPEADMAVLRRYDATEKQGSARFIVQDNHDLVFDVEFFDDASYERSYRMLTFDEQQAARKQSHIARQNSEIELPRWWERYGSLIPCDQALHDMKKDFKLAVKEEEFARKNLGQKQARLLDSLETLILNAKTYEDVAAVWPAAGDVRQQLGGRQQITVLSEDAISEIGEAMKLHQKQLTAVEQQKALPAPEPGTGAVIVIDAETVEDAA